MLNLEVNKADFYGASCQLAWSKSQTIWTEKLQCLPRIVHWQQIVIGNQDGSPNKISWIHVFDPIIEYTSEVGMVVVGCVFLITGLRFRRLLTTHFCYRIAVAALWVCQNNCKNKSVLPQTMSRLRPVVGWPDPESVVILGQVVYGNPYLIYVINHIFVYASSSYKRVSLLRFRVCNAGILWYFRPTYFLVFHTSGKSSFTMFSLTHSVCLHANTTATGSVLLSKVD